MNKITLGMTDILPFIGIVLMQNEASIVNPKDSMERQLILFVQS